jgi:hypothetical protein
MPYALGSIPRGAPVWLRGMHRRAALVLLVAALCLALSLATRLVLVARALHAGQLGYPELPRVLAAGLAYDAITSLYVVLPLMVYLAMLPARVGQARAAGAGRIDRQAAR